MSTLTALARGIYWTLGLLQGAGEVVGATKRLVKQVRRGKVPHKPGPNDTDPIPLDAQRRLRPTGKQRR
jgi:hypothetical protein